MRKRLTPSAVMSMTTFVLLLLTTAIHAQDESPLDVKIIPPGPEAASLGKYIDMPVSTYTGAPSISIPIYELKSYQLSVPISLSYHASGIKLEELSSFVGAGWTLNAGGMVSRTIRGLQDEHQRGYFSATPGDNFNVDEFFLPTGDIDYLYIANNVRLNEHDECSEDGAAYHNIFYASRGGLDLEPDLFFFSLPDGQGAKFLYDREKNLHVIPQQYTNITYTTHEPSGRLFVTFMITGRDGTKYYFEDTETTTAESYCGGSGTIDEQGQPPTIIPVSAPSTWKLTRMETQDGSDWIEFTYEDETLQYDLSTSSTVYNAVTTIGINPPAVSCGQYTSIQSKRLKSIKSRAGYEAHFYAGTERDDVDGGYKLDSIRVQYKTDEIKTVRLEQTAGQLPMLTNIGEYRDGVPLAPGHTFEYYTGPGDYLRNSRAVDHWGYANGATGNTFGAPAVIYNNKFYDGDNREPDLEYCQQWSLKKVIYPTGGTTEYEYELHDYSNIPNMGDIRYSPGLEELATIRFIASNNINDNYSDTQTFTLTDTINVVYRINIPGLPGGYLPVSGLGGILTKQGSLNPVKDFVAGESNVNGETPIIQFLPGTYTLSASFTPSQFTWTPGNYNDQPFFIEIYKVRSQQELQESNSLKGGGLRIKTIRSTGDNTITKNYRYTDPGTGMSSGKLMSFPLFAYFSIHNDDRMDCMNTCCNVFQSGNFLTRTTTSNYPLNQSSGSYIGYDVVTEYFGDSPDLPGVPNNIGYSIYKYVNQPDEEAVSTFPISPRRSNAHKNGFLIEQVDFTRDNKRVRQTQNSYTLTAHERTGIGIKIGQIASTSCILCPNRLFAISTYDQTTDLIRLSSAKVRSWGTTGDAFEESITTYTYNSFDQVTLTTQTSSLEDVAIHTAVAYHTENHLAPVNQYTYQQEGTDISYLKGSKTEYDTYGLIPKEIWLLATDEPIATEPVDDLFEKRLEYEIVTPQGRVLQYKKTGSPSSTTVIWGYGEHRDLFPIAQIINADTSTTAYTSFEHASREGGWKFGNSLNSTASVTGSKSYSALGSTAIETNNKGLGPGDYIVSFWATNSNFAITYDNGDPVTQTDFVPPTTQGAWTLYTKKITIVGPDKELKIAMTASANISLDELRLYPLGAQMSTYTYDVTTGVTNVTDPNMITTQYVYDNTNRLQLIKDFEDNILKKFEYHYERDND